MARLPPRGGGPEGSAPLASTERLPLFASVFSLGLPPSGPLKHALCHRRPLDREVTRPAHLVSEAVLASWSGIYRTFSPVLPQWGRGRDPGIVVKNAQKPCKEAAAFRGGARRQHSGQPHLRAGSPGPCGSPLRAPAAVCARVRPCVRPSHCRGGSPPFLLCLQCALWQTRCSHEPSLCD